MTQPLRVLLELNSSDLRIGAVNDALDLADFQRQLGLAFTFCGVISEDMRAAAGERDVSIIEGCSRMLSKSDLPAYAASVWRWRRILRRSAISVVHLNYAGWSPSLACAAYWCGFPIVARAGPYHPGNRIHRWVGAYVANCREQAETLLASPCADRVVIAGSLVKLQPGGASPQHAPVPPKRKDAVRILYLGQLVERKGLHVLVEAAASTSGLVEFLLVGGDWSESGYPSALRRAIAARGCNDRFILENHRPDVATLIASCDALVLPSLSEARPRVIIEAMHAGKPVIATNVGGIPSLVTHEVTGLLVPAGDAKAMAAAIDRVANSEAERTAWGNAARARADGESTFATASRYAATYRALAEHRSLTRANASSDDSARESN